MNPLVRAIAIVVGLAIAVPAISACATLMAWKNVDK